MAELKISDLDLVSSFTGTTELEVEVSGQSKKASGNQIQDMVLGTTNGLIARTAANTVAARTLTAVANGGVVVSNGDGVAGNPTVGNDWASQSDAETGSAVNKAMNPLRVAQAITARTGPKFEAKSGTFFLAAADMGKTIALSAGNVAINTNSSVPIAVGSSFGIIATSGRSIVTPLPGVTLLYNGVATRFLKEGAKAVLTKVATDTWQIDNSSAWGPQPEVWAISSSISSAPGSNPNITHANGYTAGDLQIIALETAAQTVSTPSGFTAVPNGAQATGTSGDTNATGLYCFYRVLNGSEGNTTAISLSGDHCVWCSVLVKNVDVATPIDTAAGSVAASAVTAVSMPAVTTSRNDALILAIVANATDTTSSQLSLVANSALGRLTIEAQNQSDGGNGGGISIVSGVKSAPGSTGSTTGSLATASVQARVTIAINPL